MQEEYETVSQLPFPKHDGWGKGRTMMALHSNGEAVKAGNAE